MTQALSSYFKDFLSLWDDSLKPNKDLIFVLPKFMLLFRDSMALLEFE